MCRNTEKKCMHYENGIKDEKNIWKNLSLTWHNQGLEQGIKQGLEQGLEQGIEKGANKMLFTLVTKGKLDIDTAAEEAGVSVGEFEKLMSEAGYKVPEIV